MRSKINPWKRHLPTSEEQKQESIKPKETQHKPIRMNMPSFVTQAQIEQGINPLYARQNMDIEIEEDDDTIIPDEDGYIDGKDLIDQLRKEKPTKPLKPNQVRGRFCISISVSEDDELIFRSSAIEQGKSLSAWAREAMYEYAKIKPPR